MNEHSKNLCVRANQELFGDGDLAVAAELLSEDFLDHEAPPGTPRGPQSAAGTVRWLRSGLSDIEYTVEEVVAEGDRVVLRTMMQATQDKQFFGFPPTGRTFRVQQIHIFRVEDDRIAEHWACRDDLGMMRQLGLVPAPGHESLTHPGERRSTGRVRPRWSATVASTPRRPDRARCRSPRSCGTTRGRRAARRPVRRRGPRGARATWAR